MISNDHVLISDHIEYEQDFEIVCLYPIIMVETGMSFEDFEFRGKTFDVETVFSKARSGITKRKQIKKLRGPDSPLYTSICPLVYIIRVFGLAPYEFSQNDLRPSNAYLIFSLFTLSFYSLIAYVVYMRFNGVVRDRPILGSTENAKVGTFNQVYSGGQL